MSEPSSKHPDKKDLGTAGIALIAPAVVSSSAAAIVSVADTKSSLSTQSKKSETSTKTVLAQPTPLGVRLEFDPKYGRSSNMPYAKYGNSGCTGMVSVASFLQTCHPAASIEAKMVQSIPIACHECMLAQRSQLNCKHWSVSNEYEVTLKEGAIFKTVTGLRAVTIGCNSCAKEGKSPHAQEMIVFGKANAWCRCRECNRRLILGTSQLTAYDYVRPPRALCETCKTTGKRDKSSFKKCGNCDGMGGERCSKCFGHPGRTWTYYGGEKLTSCDTCHGNGLTEKCEDCSGTGCIKFSILVHCDKCEPPIA
jgi:hypothetical protein